MFYCFVNTYNGIAFDNGKEEKFAWAKLCNKWFQSELSICMT